MPRPFWCLAVTALSAFLARPAGTQSAMPAGERARSVDVQHVALDLRLDWSRSQAAGTADITFTPRRPTRTVTLDAAHLAIERVTLANGSELAFAYDGSDRDDALAITLDRVYGAREVVTVRITYHTTYVNESDPNSLGGSTGKGLRFFRPTSTEPLKRRQAWSMGEPASNRHWFPGYDAPDDLRTTDVRITVEAPLVVVSNGRLQDTRVNTDGTRTFHWRLDVPHANHLTSFVAGEWTDVPATVDGTTLHSLGYPDEVDAVRASVERLPEMFRFMGEATGLPYPFGSYTQVFVQDVPWGTGNASMTTLTENMIDDERTHAEYRWLWDGLEAEAVATQWFGGVVSPRDWRHAWLSRGMAHYLDGLFNERRNGRGELLLWQLAGDLSATLADWAAGVRHPLVPADRAQGLSLAADNYPYSRGALVLHMLRAQLGDTAWWRGIRQYVARHAGEAVTTADFQRAMEDASGQSLSWFFDQWVYRMGHPVFEVTSGYDSARREVSLVVRQVQERDSTATYPQVGFFEGRVDLTIDDRVESVWLEPQRENTFTFPSPRPARLVGFDREGTWIKELRFARTVEELAYQVVHDPDVVGQVWAIRQLGKRLASDSTPAAERASALASLRQFSVGEGPWRARLTALFALTTWVTSAPSGAIAARLDAETRTAMRRVIAKDSSWVKAQAVTILGHAMDRRDAPLFARLLRDRFHTVNHAAAIALAQGRARGAHGTLATLMREPSWKGENILAGLAGLKALGDPRGAPRALAALADTTTRRWTLAVPRWDFRLAAAEALVAMGRASEAWPIVQRRFERSMAEGDVNDIFSNVLLMATLGDPRASAVFPRLRDRFRDDANAMNAIAAYQAQWEAARPVSR